MSFVLDHIRRIDAQLDRLQLASASGVADDEAGGGEAGLATTASLSTKRAQALQAAVRSLTPGSSDRGGLVRLTQIQSLLGVLGDQAGGREWKRRRREEQGAEEEDEEEEEEEEEEEDATSSVGTNQLEQELEWLLVSKATTQVYGHVLSTILDEAVRLSDDIWYWEEVLGSRRYTALYSMQMSPLRLWAWGSQVWEDVRVKTGGRFGVLRAGPDPSEGVTGRWRQFYGLVRQVISERSVKEVRRQILSPVTRVRVDVRRKQAALRKTRIRNANALGVLLGEGLANESSMGEGVAASNATTPDLHLKWRASVARNVALMEAVLVKINDRETTLDRFDSAVATLTNEDPLYDIESHDGALPPQVVAERLSRVMVLGLSRYSDASQALVREHGMPSRLVRYWLPIALGVISSSTVLRFLTNRQEEIGQWIQDLGSTAVDFWQNWVLEPTRNLIRTIRHDEGSEISIMSKRSLEGDRESLERMVVDFALDTHAGSPLTATELSDLRLKIREGDLTPVLKAYEKDLSSPLMGALRGTLLRALLIQIQKTKVDVEIALGGIDALLKSQELLIGFISLTPGLLVAAGAVHSLRASFSHRRGSRAQRSQGFLLRQLRNIDRILTAGQPTEYGELPYRDQGLLLCEVHLLRLAARRCMPGEIFREFGDEAAELGDVRVGVERQRRVVERMRWAYQRWLA